MIDHFSREAIRAYLAPFDRAFAGRALTGLRAFFNDSYEVDDATGQADWTPSLLEEFQKRRGYDLRRHLPALFGQRQRRRQRARARRLSRDGLGSAARHVHDASGGRGRERRRRQVRNQAHGSPASLLDLYAASDIPETEGAEIQRFKWATSAAHVAGRPLVSAEAATWLGEHFRSTLADVRAAVDRFFVAGVNHIFYHGTAYSPRGRTLARLAVLRGRRVQSAERMVGRFRHAQRIRGARPVVSAGRPARPRRAVVLPALRVAGRARKRAADALWRREPAGARDTTFEEAAGGLEGAGFTYDFISDRQIRRTRVAGGRLITGGGASYGLVVLPSARYIPARDVRARADSRGAARRSCRSRAGRLTLPASPTSTQNVRA